LIIFGSGVSTGPGLPLLDFFRATSKVLARKQLKLHQLGVARDAALLPRFVRRISPD
jgi:hypothetical protein